MKSFSTVMIMLLAISTIVNAGRTSQQITNLYRTMGDELTELRKKHPDSQPKIYLLLDQVDRMYNLSKQSIQKKKALKDRMKTKKLEHTTLQGEVTNLKNELEAAKGELVSTHDKLEETNKHFEQEKKQTAELSKEKQTPQAKIETANQTNSKNDPPKTEEEIQLEKQLESQILPALKTGKHLTKNTSYKNNKHQSLTLTSTSAPKSPR